jgi:hypothetical protein
MDTTKTLKEAVTSRKATDDEGGRDDETLHATATLL